MNKQQQLETVAKILQAATPLNRFRFMLAFCMILTRAAIEAPTLATWSLAANTWRTLILPTLAPFVVGGLGAFLIAGGMLSVDPAPAVAGFALLAVAAILARRERGQ